MPLAGAYKEAKEATPEVRGYVNAVSESIASRLGVNKTSLGDLTAHSYISRAVLGGNFTVKVILGNGDIIHVKINNLPGAGPQLVGLVTGLSLDSPIEPIST